MRTPHWAGIWFIAAALLTPQPATAQVGLADAFNPDATNGYVFAAAVQADGKVFVAGNFNTIGGYTLPNDFVRPGFFRLNADGTRDSFFAANIQGGPVECIAVQPDGRLVMGGDFGYANGYSMHNMVRLNADGTLPTTGVPPTTVPAFFARPDGHVSSIALLPDGKILILGTFTTMESGAISRSHIARLNADGSLDAGFNPTINSGLTCMALQPDGKLIVGGSAALIGGVSRTVARLTTTGAVDSTFADPGADGAVSAIVVQPDGKLIVGGSFQNISGGSRPGVVRLNADGTLDSTFSTLLDSGSSLRTIALQADGRIILGGLFFAVNSTFRQNIARVLPNGALETTFNPISGGELFCAALQADGRLVVTGTFQHDFIPHALIGGQLRNRIARLTNDSATGSISVPSQTQITWARGGSSPEAFSVRFELSNDGGGTWTTLGEGTRISGGWEITGLALPATGIVRGVATVPVTYYGGTSSSIVTSSRAYAYAPAAEVATLAATNLAAVSATLNATIDPNGSATSAHFQFGLTAAYGSTLPITLIPSDGTAPLSVSPTANGLTPHVTYHYRVVATNGTGTSYGEDFTFFTNATPNTPALSINTIAENEAVSTAVGTLGTVTDSDGEIITYSLVAGDGDFDNASFMITGNTLRTNEVFNFEGQRSYHVRVRAADGFTNGTAEAALTITIVNVIEPPSAITGTASSIRHSSATLHGVVNSNSVETSVTFEYGLTTSYGATVPGFLFPPDDVVSQALEVRIGGLLPATTYHYRITVSSDDGADEGVDQTFTTRSTSPGDVELAFNPDVQGGAVQCTALQSDGKILIGGFFNQVNGQPRSNLARLNADGSLDLSFDPNPDSAVNCIAVQMDGKIIIGGYFSQIGAIPRSKLARLTFAGAVDTTFTPSVNGDVHVLLANAPQDKLYISGSFTAVSGQPRSGFARLLDSGLLDGTLSDMAPDGQVKCMMQFDESEGVVVGGDFSVFGGETRHGLARVNNIGEVVGGTSGLVFADPGSNIVSLIRVTDAVLVGGGFSTFGGLPLGSIARITIDDRELPIGVTRNHPFVDGSFNPIISGGVSAMAAQADGRIIIGGNFSEVNTVPVSSLARLNADDTLDTTFDPAVRSQYFNSSVHGVMLQYDGRVLIHGLFSDVGGEPQTGLARLHNGSATQVLSSSYNHPALWNLSWQRSGTAPEIIHYPQILWRDSYGQLVLASSIASDSLGAGVGTSWVRPNLGFLLGSGATALLARGRVGGGSMIMVQTVPFVTQSLNEWRSLHFGTTSNTGTSADDADHDLDGVANLLEYALGTSPTSAAGRALPEGGSRGAGASARFEIRFTQPAGVTGVVYGAEWTSTLGGAWTAVPDTGVLPEHVFSVPIGGESRGFMRIVVTRTP